MAKSDLLLQMIYGIKSGSLDVEQKARIARAIVDELPEAELDELVDYIMGEAIPAHLSRRLKENTKP